MITSMSWRAVAWKMALKVRVRLCSSAVPAGGSCTLWCCWRDEAEAVTDMVYATSLPLICWSG